MNKVMQTLVLTQDAELRYGNGTAVARIRGAVRRQYVKEGSNVTSDFFSWVAFGKHAEFLEKYGKKGVKFEIIGRLVNNNYTDKDGKKIYRDELTVESIEFAERKNAAANLDSNVSPAPVSSSANVPTRQDPPARQNPQDGFMNIDYEDEDELPFN